MNTSLLIASRFCGPPDSGNGGYSAGLLASTLGGAVEVTLRKPPPLEIPLCAEVSAERAELKLGDALIAEARRAKPDVTPPAAPSFEQATVAATHYVGHRRHHFPTCFVCGPARLPGDGLRIFPGSEQPEQPALAPWTPEAVFGDDSGRVRSEVLWAALDCVGYFAAAAPHYPVALLGRMTAEVRSRPRSGERCVVAGWSLGRDGRKLQAGTAVFGADGSVCGLARQTWILLNQ